VAGRRHPGGGQEGSRAGWWPGGAGAGEAAAGRVAVGQAAGHRACM
jgi:hypothetical protein